MSGDLFRSLSYIPPGTKPHYSVALFTLYSLPLFPSNKCLTCVIPSWHLLLGGPKSSKYDPLSKVLREVNEDRDGIRR